MDKKDLKIGLALSGGGIRAVIFHLGVMQYLAENSLLENVTHISSVSGASMCVGLIYCNNGLVFPDSKTYLSKTLPSIRDIILNKNLQSSSILDAIFNFGLFKKANVIATSLEKYWNIYGDFSKLPKLPLWTINCTAYETGKNFHFSQEIIGDWAFGFIKNRDYPLSHAIASSAAFPFLIGTFQVDTSAFDWCDINNNDITPPSKTLNLWDGGVYDNLGLEPIYKMEKGGFYVDNVNFCILSNAGRAISFENKDKLNLTRIVDVTTDQIAILRARNFKDFINRNKNGLFVKMGRDAVNVAIKTGASVDLGKELAKDMLSKELCDKVGLYPTTLKSPSVDDYELILKHGYESVKCARLCYGFI